jgi:hypothetical protein
MPQARAEAARKHYCQKTFQAKTTVSLPPARRRG